MPELSGNLELRSLPYSSNHALRADALQVERGGASANLKKRRINASASGIGLLGRSRIAVIRLHPIAISYKFALRTGYIL